MPHVREKEFRRQFLATLGGKMLGLMVLFAVMAFASVLFFTSAHAADAPAPPPYVNPINTVWTLIAAFLVFFMQAGFMCLEAGFSRTKESVNIILEGIVDTCLCGLLFWASPPPPPPPPPPGFIGHQYFFLANTPDTYGTTGVPM